MSVNSKMVLATVLELKETESLSGARKSIWIELSGKIKISLYQASQFASKDRFRHTETTHNAITPYKGLKSSLNKLVIKGVKYEILDVDNSHRLAQLSLREVRSW